MTNQERIKFVIDDVAKTIMDRGEERDLDDGERTIPRCVIAFNAITGNELSAEDGWLFMQILKMCRSKQGGFKYDDYRDGVGYAALRAEEALKNNDDVSGAPRNAFRVIINTETGDVRPLTEAEQRPGAIVKLEANEHVTMQFIPPTNTPKKEPTGVNKGGHYL